MTILDGGVNNHPEALERFFPACRKKAALLPEPRRFNGAGGHWRLRTHCSFNPLTFKTKSNEFLQK